MTLPSRLVVVEPHADDAWLSLGGHIAEWRRLGKAVHIVTVYGDERRWAEAAAYADRVGASWACAGLPEGGHGLRAGDWTPQRPTLGDLDLDGGDGVCWPLGLRHPEHRAVASLAPDGAWRYVELPYALTTANAAEATLMLTGRYVESWFRPNFAAKNAVAGIFRSQALFWYRNRDRLRHAPEVIVR